MNEKVLDQFLSGIKKGSSGTDMRVLKPWGPFQLDPYFFDLWAQKINTAVDKIRAKKIKISEVSEAFPSNAVIRDVLVYFVIGMKVLKVPKKERVARAKFFLEALRKRSHSKDFSFLKENLILEKHDIEDIIKKKKWTKPQEEQKRQFGLLAASLRSLMWSLYTDIFPNNGFEISGPYNLSGKKQLIVRDFFGLKPKEIWKDDKSFPSKHITLYAIYEKANISIFMFNRVYSKKSLKDCLTSYSVKGQKVKNLNRLNDKIGDYIMAQEKRFDELNFEEKKKIYIKIKHYALKNFFELAGLNWEPEKTFYQRVAGKELIKTKDMKIEPSKAAEIYEKTADPRNDFLPSL